MASGMDGGRVRRFSSVECDGLTGCDEAAVFPVEVTEGHVTIGGDRLDISADKALMVCCGGHADRRVKLMYREQGQEQTLYLSCKGPVGKVRGNKRLYAALHDALLQ